MVVAGSFGRGNAGDEAAWLAVGDLARQCGMDCQVRVLTRFSRGGFANVMGTGKEDAERRRAMCAAPAVIVGGGVIEPGRHSVLMRCLPALEGAGAGPISVFAGAVEAGVKYGWLDVFRLRRRLSRVREVSVRDVISAGQLNKLLPGREFEVVGDIVLAMDSSLDEPPPLELPERYIAVSLAPRWHGDEAWTGWIAQQIHRIARDLHCDLVLVPFSTMHDDDRPDLHAVASRVERSTPKVAVSVIDLPLTPRQIGNVLSKAQLVIGMRLHANVMAYARRVPFVPLGYHPKLAAFIRTIGQDQLLLSESSSARQSAGHYGYTFADSGLPQSDLVAAAHRAMASADCSKLALLRQSLGNALRRCASS